MIRNLVNGAPVQADGEAGRGVEEHPPPDLPLHVRSFACRAEKKILRLWWDLNPRYLGH